MERWFPQVSKNIHHNHSNKINNKINTPPSLRLTRVLLSCAPGRTKHSITLDPLLLLLLLGKRVEGARVFLDVHEALARLALARAVEHHQQLLISDDLVTLAEGRLGGVE